ncbi:Hypothetical_protein [Hexamita inflata]|uniref:Hypothetical_protein n=1 Tax=Hexamita inflata TaxID=28002 RepID=A0AA86QWW6_9EUKA|nr:Hypothetical protein HINF_LOCUS48579 [Hexamita inflata]
MFIKQRTLYLQKKAYGPEYTASNNRCSCKNSNQQCTCQTERCCNQQNPPLTINKGICKSCQDVFGHGVIIKDGKCQCGLNSFGILSKEGDKCSSCQGVVSVDTKTCTSCQQAYGPDYIWDAAQRFCVCSKGNKCSCSTELCCKQNQTHLINGKCTTCLEEVGINYILSNYLQDSSLNLNLPMQQCVCPNPAICKCVTDYCCSLTFQTFYNGVCTSCSQLGQDYAFDEKSKKCIICSELMSQDKQKCVYCSDSIPNSIFSAGSCVCAQNYKFKNGQCVKNSNRTIGLAVGIPVGVFVVGVSAATAKKVVKKAPKTEETTAETVQVAVEDVELVQETVKVE